ncbi:MAG: phosphoenolpyruvate--protein phosphotransferase [Burkholderiaceae bacterium]
MSNNPSTDRTDHADHTFRHSLKLPNPLGLHARPATQLSKMVKKLDARVFIESESGQRADCRKMFELLGLGLSHGAAITVISDDEAVLRSVVSAIETGLGDDLDSQPNEPKLQNAMLWAPQGEIRMLQGVGASDGLVIGTIRHHHQQHFNIPSESAQPTEEIALFNQAVAEAQRAILSLMNAAGARTSVDQAAIFEAHLALLDDKDMVSDTFARIAEGENAARAYKHVTDARIVELSNVSDVNIAARAADIRDIRNRVISILLGVEQNQAHYDTPAIICAEDLTPSDTSRLKPDQVLGFITAMGGPTSHSAIIARGMGLPAVVAIGQAIRELPEDTTVIMDGVSGRVYIEPTTEQIASAREAQAALQQQLDAALTRRMEPGQTADGVAIQIGANINSAEAAAAAIDAGAQGVGLMRTEFLYLERDSIPNEDEQEAAYRALAQAMGERPLIIRTLDIGGDKEVPYLGLAHEDNAFLGIRGIRLCFERPDLFMPQLRAICRVAKDHANIHVMFPMIGKLSDWMRAKELLDEARQQIGAPKFPVGVMIEVPSAALIAPHLAKHVDFFSIGTNDLTQYTLAMDRMHPLLANQTDAMHPAVLQLIDMTVKAALAHGKWVGVCGGAAGEVAAAKVLVGLGVRELSMSPPQIAVVKQALRQYRLDELQDLAQRVLAQGSSKAVRDILREHA